MAEENKEEPIKMTPDEALKTYREGEAKMRKVVGDLEEKIRSIGTLAEWKGITKDELNSVYHLGYNYYVTGNMERAQTLFAFLTLMDPLTERNWVALAGAYENMKEYAKALACYSFLSAVFGFDNSTYSLRAARCHLAAGDLMSAENALAHATAHADAGSPEGRKALAEIKRLHIRLEGLRAQAAAK